MPCFGSLIAPDTVFDIQDGQAVAGAVRAAVWCRAGLRTVNIKYALN